MSNPVVTVGDTIATPADPEQEWEQFTRVTFEQKKFFVYAQGESGLGVGTGVGDFNASLLGEDYFIFYPIMDVVSKPDFITDNSWTSLKLSPSGFVNPVTHSVLPMLLIPTDILVGNGWKSYGNKLFAKYPDGGYGWKNLFNWEIVTWNGASVGAMTTILYDLAQTGGFMNSQYISVKAKDDADASNIFVMKLENPASPPLGSSHDFLKADSSNLVVGGAFAILVNVIPHRQATASPLAVGKEPWEIVFELDTPTFIKLTESGLEIATEGDATYAPGGEGNYTPIDLAEGKSKQSPPARPHMHDKEPYLILVYPVWNGFIVTNGIQAAQSSVAPSSYFVPKFKKATILDAEYNPSGPFDPTAPAVMEVGIGTTNVAKVDFGPKVTVTAKNCRFEMAYQPMFFMKQCKFDQFFVAAKDTANDEYTYNIWPIWTKNGTATTLTPPVPAITTLPGVQANQFYWKSTWALTNPDFDRYGAELFGGIMQVKTKSKFPVKNLNGNYALGFGAANPGDSASTGNWEDYIQSVNVTVGLDGSNGTISVDKYGVAGQQATAVQSIGAITLSATGGYGTQAGSIFKGLGFGVADAQSADGATWTVRLEGLEKKLDDIALINVPFFDGFKSGVVMTFLAKYAGLIDDQANADPNIDLTISEDLNVPYFNWQTGTSVKSALDQLMDNINHNYVVRDGKIFFYRLDPVSGLPTAVTTDWEPTYPSTKLIMVDESPDFEDLRNEIIGIALQQVPEGQGAKLENLPIFPRIVALNNTTNPVIAWSKALVMGLEAMLAPADIDAVMQKVKAKATNYIVVGSTQIPGNANIKPYDKWGSLWISSVSHTIDLVSKVWTTELQFASG